MAKKTKKPVKKKTVKKSIPVSPAPVKKEAVKPASVRFALLDVKIDKPKYRFRAVIKYVLDEIRKEAIVYANSEEEARMNANAKIQELQK